MLAHRLRRWTNIKPALAQRLVLAGHAYMANKARGSCLKRHVFISVYVEEFHY